MTTSEAVDTISSVATFDWQGHRGARGLLPENTIAAFLRALSYPAVTTLELDVVISKDHRVIVSHEPWMSGTICSQPDGSPLTPEAGRKISLLTLTAVEIATYDCGQRPHPRFPTQQPRPANKPTLAAVFAAIDRYCQQHDRPLPAFNIEIKYLPEHEGTFVPDPATFVRLVLEDIDAWGHPDRVTLQCFEPSVLAIIRQLRPDIRLAYLDEFPGEIAEKMTALGFVPPVYSPYFLPLTREMIAEAHQLGMAVIPWTVNEVNDMTRLRTMGVAGIITDYPDRIPLTVSSSD